jgi:hypothetical protein
MPVPPIFQPEVAARAVYWAAHERRREVYVGLPTVYTTWGNEVAPWLVDRYLAKTNVKGQLDAADKPPDRPDNLFEPVPGDPGAHGPYDGRSHGRSVQLWATKHRRGLLAGAGLAGLAAAARAARDGR